MQCARTLKLFCWLEFIESFMLLDYLDAPSIVIHSTCWQKPVREDDGEEDDIDEDAIETLFSLLEEDLKKDLPDDDGHDEITEEDLAKLEQELEEALGDIDFEEHPEGLPVNSASTGDVEDSDEEERPPVLKNWQAKRLAYALKIGRRKTSIKSLAAELGLDRAFVLELLRDPPPQLLLMSSSLPDKVLQITSELKTTPAESSPTPTDTVAENEPEVHEPVHVKQTRWFMQKRPKKVHVETLERVYSRTKRPTVCKFLSTICRW